MYGRVLEVVGAKGFEPSTSWSRTSLSKIPKPSSWRHLRDLEQQKIPLRFTTIRNRQLRGSLGTVETPRNSISICTFFGQLYRDQEVFWSASKVDLYI